MIPDEDREEECRLLRGIEADINHLTATMAEDMAQRSTTPRQVAAMEHLLVILETLRNGYLASIEAFDRGDPELGEVVLDEVSALRIRLFQKLGLS
jgi:hypothetical protein